jgi:hypothetical protein
MDIMPILQQMNIANLLAMAVLLWIFYNRLDAKFEKRFGEIDKKFDSIDKRFDKVDARFDKIEEKVTDIDRRLCRMEGAFSQKECCMLKHDSDVKKVG